MGKGECPKCQKSMRYFDDSGRDRQICPGSCGIFNATRFADGTFAGYVQAGILYPAAPSKPDAEYHERAMTADEVVERESDERFCHRAMSRWAKLLGCDVRDVPGELEWVSYYITNRERFGSGDYKRFKKILAALTEEGSTSAQ